MQERPERLVRQAAEERTVSRDDKATQERPVHLDLGATSALKVLPASAVSKGVPAVLAARDSPASRVVPDRRALRGQLGLVGRVELPVPREPQDPLDSRAVLAYQVRVVGGVIRDWSVRLDPRDSRGIRVQLVQVVIPALQAQSVMLDRKELLAIVVSICHVDLYLIFSFFVYLLLSLLASLCLSSEINVHTCLATVCTVCLVYHLALAQCYSLMYQVHCAVAVFFASPQGCRGNWISLLMPIPYSQKHLWEVP